MHVSAVTENLRKLLGETQVGRQLLADKDSRILADRRSLVGQIQQLRERQDRELPPLRALEEPARQEVDALRTRLREAEVQLASKAHAANSLSFEVDSAIGRHERQLRETCDPRIVEFLDEMRKLFEKERHRTEPSNLSEMRLRLAAIRSAIERAQAMMLEASEDVEWALAALRIAIPVCER